MVEDLCAFTIAVLTLGTGLLSLTALPGSVVSYALGRARGSSAAFLVGEVLAAVTAVFGLLTGLLFTYITYATAMRHREIFGRIEHLSRSTYLVALEAFGVFLVSTVFFVANRRPRNAVARMGEHP